MEQTFTLTAECNGGYKVSFCITNVRTWVTVHMPDKTIITSLDKPMAAAKVAESLIPLDLWPNFARSVYLKATTDGRLF